MGWVWEKRLRRGLGSMLRRLSLSSNNDEGPGRLKAKAGLFLSLLTVALFRRRAVTGADLFAPARYRQDHPQTPRGATALMLYHLRHGEARGFNPSPFFHTAWFRRIHADRIPGRASPLVWFLLAPAEAGLCPHWRVIFPDLQRRTFQVLLSKPGGGLKLSDELGLNEGWSPSPALKLSGPWQEPAADFGWVEISQTSAARVSDLSRKHGLPVEATYEARPARLDPIKGFIGAEAPEARGAAKAGYSAYMAHLKNIVAVGAETALWGSDGTYCRDGDAGRRTRGNYYAHQIMARRHLPRGGLEAWRLKELQVIARGILLMCRSDLNYWHWTVEILPRLVPLLDRINHGPLRQWPILISRGLPVSHEESLRLLVPHSPLTPVDRQRLIKVENAIYPSEINRYYSRPEAGEALANSDVRLDVPILRRLREELLARVNLVSSPGSGRKILVDRLDRARSLANRAEVVALAERRGFELIRPEELSLAKQLETFHQASHIILCSGAEAANLMFASRGAAAAVIMPRGLGQSYRLWQTQATCSGADLYIIYGERAGADTRPLHDQMILPPDRLEEYFRQAGL